MIEASGLADPAPILFTLVTDPVLQHHFYVDAIITTVDAVNGRLQVELHEETRKQIAVADELILTKVDMATPTDVAALAERLRVINPSARVVEAVFGRVEGELILDGEPARERALREFLRTRAEPIAGSHAHNTQALSLTFDVPLDWVAFGVWLSMLLESRGQDVLRIKGLVDVREVGPVVINGVQHVIHPPEHLEVWPSEDKRSRLVFVTRNIDPKMLRRSLEVFQRIGDPTWRSRLAG